MRLMNQQMEALQRLVTESGKREALVRETFGTEKPKLTKLTARGGRCRGLPDNI